MAGLQFAVVYVMHMLCINVITPRSAIFTKRRLTWRFGTTFDTKYGELRPCREMWFYYLIRVFNVGFCKNSIPVEESIKNLDNSSLSMFV